MDPPRRKIISWCFYVDPNNARRLPEYLLGLRCNQRAARMWFRDWELRLYIDETVRANPKVAEFIKSTTEYGWPSIEVIQCRAGVNPMVERYRPMLENDVAVCLARDIDSILSKTDADLVDKWLADDGSDVLRYREYQMMCKWAMGGGVGVKTRAFKGVDIAEVPLITKQGRGHDESALAKMLMKIPEARQTEIITRMLLNGVYCFYQPDSANTKEAKVLWPTPFFDCYNGYADNKRENWRLKDASHDVVVLFCEEAKIRREHMGGHWDHHRDALVNGSQWVR